MTNTVDVEATGTYKVVYSVNDYATTVGDLKACAANKTIVTRTIIVIDSLQPVIGLQFENDAAFTTFHSGKSFAVKKNQTQENDSDGDSNVNSTEASSGHGTLKPFNSDQTLSSTVRARNRDNALDDGGPLTYLHDGNPADLWSGWNQPPALMAQMTTVNGWMIAAAAAAVSGVALLAVGKKPSAGLSELV